jgi:hypothetical protein
MQLMGSASDADLVPANCPGVETLHYTWNVRDGSGGAVTLTPLDSNGNCAAPTASSSKTLVVTSPMAQVCLNTDPSVAGGSAYTVTLTVDDGNNNPTGGLTPLSVGVSADEPPCITGVAPEAGDYVVDRTQIQQFDVAGVIDDRDTLGQQLGLVWSVRRDSDTTWTEVPNWRVPSYQLDLSSYGVGETVHVRVEAIDRTCTDPATCTNSACPTTTADCIVNSCVSMTDACHKWKTWDLELR